MAKSARSRKRPVSKTPAAAEKTTAPVTTPLWNRLIFGVALFGLLLTVHFWVQAERGFDRGCLGLSDPATVTAEVGCSAVVTSSAGKIFGVSNIAFGFLFYLAIAALSFSTVFWAEKRSLLRRISFGLAVLGFLYSAYLTLYQLSSLDDVCVLCLISAATVTVLLGLHLAEFIKRAVPSFDTHGLLTELGGFAMAAFLAGSLIVADMLFVNGLGTRSAGTDEATVQQIVQQTVPTLVNPNALRQQPLAGCTYGQEPAPVTDFEKYIGPDEQFEGSADAPVRVVKFFDPNCPACKALHQQMDGIVAASGNQARFYYQPFPIWSISMNQVQALYLAQEEGKFIEMMDAQFERQKQGGLSEGELIEIAQEIGLNLESFRSGLSNSKYLVQIQAEREQMQRDGITSFPKLAIEGQFVATTRQSMTQACISNLINNAYTERPAGD